MFCSWLCCWAAMSLWASPAIHPCAATLLLVVGATKRTTSECLREARGKVNGHSFQLGTWGALLMHTSCASGPSFGASQRGVDLSPSIINSVSLSKTKILIDQKSGFFPWMLHYLFCVYLIDDIGWLLLFFLSWCLRWVHGFRGIVRICLSPFCLSPI